MASSIDAIPAKKLEELLECSFCLDTLNDPRTLPCFHSFCKCCLEKFVHGEGNRDENPDQGDQGIKNFECPNCRSEFTVDLKEGAAGIATNYFIRNMLDVMAVESRVKGIPCGHCENPSVARCVTCEFFLCEKCLEGHNNYLGFRQHSVLSMDELSEPENRFKIRGTPRCKEHDDEALKHFCETCEELICRDCKDYNHNNHKCSPLKKTAEQKTEELNTHYQKLTKEVAEVNKALEAMTGVDKSLEDNVKTAKQKISARKEEILEVVRRNLDEKENSLLREIDNIYLFKHEALEEQLKETEAYVKKIQNSVDMCAGLLKNGSPVEIASSHKQVCTNIENARKAERPENLIPDNDGGIPFNSSSMSGLDAEIEKISQRMGNIKSTDHRWCFNTSNKLRVVVYQGDIIKENTDIIVSSCDSKLNLISGVALAIANAGGPSIRKESNEYLKKRGALSAENVVATIGPGLLKCKKILLAASPYWGKHGKDESIKRLTQVLGNIFETASTLKAKSLAMPAIGSGLCGMAKEVCAQTLLSFFKELGDQNLTSNIKRPFEIRLVDIDKSTIDVLVETFTNGCLKK